MPSCADHRNIATLPFALALSVGVNTMNAWQDMVLVQIGQVGPDLTCYNRKEELLCVCKFLASNLGRSNEGKMYSPQICVASKIFCAYNIGTVEAHAILSQLATCLTSAVSFPSHQVSPSLKTVYSVCWCSCRNNVLSLPSVKATILAQYVWRVKDSQLFSLSQYMLSRASAGVLWQLGSIVPR